MAQAAAATACTPAAAVPIAGARCDGFIEKAQIRPTAPATHDALSSSARVHKAQATSGAITAKARASQNSCCAQQLGKALWQLRSRLSEQAASNAHQTFFRFETRSISCRFRRATVSRQPYRKALWSLQRFAGHSRTGTASITLASSISSISSMQRRIAPQIIALPTRKKNTILTTNHNPQRRHRKNLD